MSLVRRSFSPFDVLLPTLRALDATVRRDVPLDISLSDDDLQVVASLPGFRRDEIEATINGNILHIKASQIADEGAEQEADKPQREYLQREIARGEAECSVRLPSSLDTAKASSSFTDGILTLTIPRSESSKPVTVKIA